MLEGSKTHKIHLRTKPSFDMTMTIFPAVILAALSGIINLTGLIYGFTLKSII